MHKNVWLTVPTQGRIRSVFGTVGVRPRATTAWRVPRRRVGQEARP
ncbi:hypothetical protein [Alicyclobacillus pomorum]|jgi:hypothetical protein|nr:hypothetical protein [Alicyclobacillus pomorum]